MRWEHPAYAAGCAAEIAEFFCKTPKARWYGQLKCWNASTALWRGALRAKTDAERRRVLQRVARILGWHISKRGDFSFPIGAADDLPTYPLAVLQRELMEDACVMLATQHTDGLFNARLIQALDEQEGSDDETQRIELRWRIRDWLHDTPVNNVPPNIRLAAAAAWSAEHGKIARSIVVEAAMGTRHGR
jgi:hypothetical protein